MKVQSLRNPKLSESELKMETVRPNWMGINFISDFDLKISECELRNAANEVARLIAELKRCKTRLDHLKKEMIAAQAERDYLGL
ncbi:unnamed protein product [Peronospora belbahrii]|uniref:Uncharacterized protein n=1 Tax=Peronospora belbahrii TaxID=622444 RepID=A0AAU9KT29_9STRA|nr:unnamed protein product [Peronospora belbahrii]CAH0521426.1 unnamed protein product [Peronospora belbahrii]